MTSYKRQRGRRRRRKRRRRELGSVSRGNCAESRTDTESSQPKAWRCIACCTSPMSTRSDESESFSLPCTRPRISAPPASTFAVCRLKNITLLRPFFSHLIDVKLSTFLRYVLQPWQKVPILTLNWSHL